MLFKQRVAGWVQRWPPLRWGVQWGVRLLVPRHYVGAVGAVFNDAGQVLLMEHVFRLNYPLPTTALGISPSAATK